MYLKKKKTSLRSLVSEKLLKILSSCIIMLSSSVMTYAQKPDLDPNVRYGKLSNGFTYYIRHNEEPQKRAQLYLVNKVGSVLETEKQRGLAHFLEHMAFNGTTHFPKNELITYLQKSGIRFGSDLNAYTSFDETVYQLPIPTDDEMLFQNGLQIMRDWAQGLLLNQEEIDKERGIILEEKRLRQGAQQRISDKTLPLLLNNSIYANRLPIGTEEVLKSFKREDIVSFYKDWYRPDLQAIIIVGDIDTDKIEQDVKRLFSDLKMPKKIKSRNQFPIALTGKNQFITVTDAEVSRVDFELQIKHQKIVAETDELYKSSLLRSIATQLLSARISDYAKDPNIPMLGIQAGYGDFLANLSVLSLSIAPKEGKLQQAIEAGWKEISQIKKFGFTQAELDRVKKDFQAGMDRMLAEKDKRNSSQFVSEYQRHFTTSEMSPGLEYEYKLVTSTLSDLSLDSVNAEIKKMLKEVDRDIIITGPENEKLSLPDEANVSTWLKNGENQAIKAYEETESTTELLPTLPAEGKIVRKEEIKELGITKLTFSNGINVILKPTDFKNDAILFRSFSPGGTSVYGDNDFETARNAAGILSASGVGQHTPISLPRLLTGKKTQVTPFISDYYEGINGSSSVKDLETTLQLVYLYFTQPKADPEIFKKILGNAEINIKTRYDKPENVFSDTISNVMSNYNYRRMPTTLDRLKGIDLDRALAIYRDRFADASDFTFVFTGSFKVNEIEPLLNRYLGSLPAINRNESFRNLNIKSPKGLVSKTVYKGKEDKATVVMVFDGTFKFEAKENLKLKALEQVLNFRLLERLREKESGVYTPSVNASSTKIPDGRYSLVASFGCSPKNVEPLIKATLDEVKLLQENGVSDLDLQKFISEEKRQNEIKIRDNAFWAGYLLENYRNGEDPREILSETQLLNELTTHDIQQAAKDYLNRASFKRFVNLPESK